MDKRQFTAIIEKVYKTLTPKKVSVFIKNEEIVNIRVISDTFQNMIFPARFKILNDMLKSNEPSVFANHLFVFEAFTPSELQTLPVNENSPQELDNEDFKKSAISLDS